MIAVFAKTVLGIKAEYVHNVPGLGLVRAKMSASCLLPSCSVAFWSTLRERDVREKGIVGERCGKETAEAVWSSQLN